jgi:hypothetical protein
MFIKILKRTILDSVSNLGHPRRILFPKGCVLKVVSTPRGYLFLQLSASGVESWSCFFTQEEVELL